MLSPKCLLSCLVLCLLPSLIGRDNFYIQPVPLYPGARPATVLSVEDEALLDDLQRASFKFFVEQTSPITGLVRDRARADGSPSTGKGSISVSGFALSSWVVATHRGWAGRTEAVEQIRAMLRFLATKAPREHGFFYHFMEMDTGERAWKCELSSIDTALFLAGAIVAREYFQDPEITALVNQLYEDMDWTWFLNGGDTVSLSWHPETGFSRFRWNNYSEHLMMSFLALGAPRQALEAKHWRAWARTPSGSYAGYHYVMQGPLFIHQFTHSYVDFRGRRDAFADYYQNSMLASLAQRQFCIDLRKEFPSWSERLWGITASDSATGYKAWGGPPRTLQDNALDGTIAPCATAGSVPFTPFESMIALRHMRTVYGDKIWKRYGFVDAFNPQTGWINQDVIGIDLGITLLQAENARSGLIWALFMQAPEVQRAVRKAGLISESRLLSLDMSRSMQGLAAQAWQSIDDLPPDRENAGIQLTAIISSHALGLISTQEAITRARDFIGKAPMPLTDVGIGEYAASLITLRQALPMLSPEASAVFDRVKWKDITLSSKQLGSASRLTAFLQVATEARPTTAWTDLTRDPIKVGPVYALAPAQALDQFVPGLWLDERSIITGASANQFAYAALIDFTEGAQPPRPRDMMTNALILDRFPAEAAERVRAQTPPANWTEKFSPTDRAVLLISVANVLVPDCTRTWFQADPVVERGRSLLKEFAEAAFGKNTSLTSRFELNGPVKPRPNRRARAVSADLPSSLWDWHTVAGLEYKVNSSDTLPSDPPLEMRFAFTWDQQALHFHAEVADAPFGYQMPERSNRFVELYLDAVNDNFIWTGKDDYQFFIDIKGAVNEWFHHAPAQSNVRICDNGYAVEVDIPWKSLNLTPQVGMEIGVGPGVTRESFREWQPTLKLNWCFQREEDERIILGNVRLE